MLEDAQHPVQLLARGHRNAHSSWYTCCIRNRYCSLHIFKETTWIMKSIHSVIFHGLNSVVKVYVRWRSSWSQNCFNPNLRTPLPRPGPHCAISCLRKPTVRTELILHLRPKPNHSQRRYFWEPCVTWSFSPRWHRVVLTRHSHRSHLHDHRHIRVERSESTILFAVFPSQWMLVGRCGND